MQLFARAPPSIVGVQAVAKALPEFWPAEQDSLALQELDGPGDIGSLYVKGLGDLCLLDVDPIFKVKSAEEDHEDPVGAFGQVIVFSKG